MDDNTLAESTKNNWLLFIPLAVLTGILTIAGALVAYYLVTEQMGYTGGKSGVFYIGGAFVGYSIAAPLWKLYRRRYPKAAKQV
ncbi:MAG: hypothetical protein R3D99_11855 [Altererythrobacter sp.]